MPTMPNIVGVNAQQATATLIAAGVIPNDGVLLGTQYPVVGYFSAWPVSVTWQRSESPAWTVTAQAPSAGAGVAFNSPVSITVAAPPFGVSSLYTAGGYS